MTVKATATSWGRDQDRWSLAKPSFAVSVGYLRGGRGRSRELCGEEKGDEGKERRSKK